MINNLRDLIGGALGSAGLQTTSDVWQLAEVWRAALGAQIAGKATPVRLVRGELVIAVAEAVWRQELALLAPQISARLNQAVGREVVQRIRLVGGDASPGSGADETRPRRRLARTSTATPASAPPRTPSTANVDGELSEDLAAALRSLAAKRAERIVADDAPHERRDRPSTAAPPRKRW